MTMQDVRPVAMHRHICQYYYYYNSYSDCPMINLCILIVSIRDMKSNSSLKLIPKSNSSLKLQFQEIEWLCLP